MAWAVLSTAVPLGRVPRRMADLHTLIHRQHHKFDAAYKVPFGTNNHMEMNLMLVDIDKIQVSPGRIVASQDQVKALSQSISDIGLLNPITIGAMF